MIPGQNELKIHVCIGLPLFADEELIGALTFDGLNPAQFDAFSDKELWLIGALEDEALYNALLVDELEAQALPTAAEANSKKQITWQAEGDMVVSSASMQQLRHEINVVAGSDLNVLITGEMGVGKSLSPTRYINYRRELLSHRFILTVRRYRKVNFSVM